MTELEIALAEIYRDLEAWLYSRLLVGTANHWNQRRFSLLLQQVEAEISRVEQEVEDLTLQIAEQAFEDGVAKAEDLVGDIGFRTGEEIWFQLNREAVLILARESIGAQRTFLRESVLRKTQDYIREIQAREVTIGTAFGIPTRTTGAAIRDRITRRAIEIQTRSLAENLIDAISVTYSNGARHSLEYYGQMAARTAYANTMTESMMATYIENGSHLFQVSIHGTLCSLCAHYEGKVFALDAVGVSMGYPTIDRDLPFHPNCMHFALPYQGMNGPKIDPAVLGMTNRELYQHMKSLPNGAQKQRWARQGFTSEHQAREMTAQGIAHGPNYRQPGIEERRIEATRRVIESGGRLTYADAMRRMRRGR